MPDPLHQWRCAQHPEITGTCFCDQPEGPHLCDGCKEADALIETMWGPTRTLAPWEEEASP